MFLYNTETNRKASLNYDNLAVSQPVFQKNCFYFRVTSDINYYYYHSVERASRMGQSKNSFIVHQLGKQTSRKKFDLMTLIFKFHTNNEVFIINIFDLAFLFRFIHLLVDRLLRSCYFSVISRVTCLGEWCISLFHGVESRNFSFRAFLDEAWLCCNWLCDWVSWELSVPQLLYQVTSYFYCKKHEIW